jgi:hypothetical protein
MIALAAAAVPITSNADSGNLVEQLENIPACTDLEQDKNNLMKHVA